MLLTLLVEGREVYLRVVLLQNVVLDVVCNQGRHACLLPVALQDAQVELHPLVEHLQEVLVVFLHVIGRVRVKSPTAHPHVDVLPAGLE